MSRREGTLFRRCRTCGLRGPAPAKTCRRIDDSGESCGGEVAWGFAVDVAPPGSARRKRVTHSGFPTKSDALAAMREVQEAAATGRLVEPTRMTVEDYLTQWLAASRSRIGYDLSESGWRDYEIHIRRHIVPGIGDVPLQALDRNQVKAFYGWVQDGNSSRGGRCPSPKTVHNIHLTFHRALEDAVDDSLIARNPAAKARSAPTQSEEMLTWNETQLRLFLASVSDDRQYPVWHLAAMSGMRRGEVLGLKWDDLDTNASTITINRQWKRGEKGLVMSRPKTERGRRTIDIDSETIAVLKQWRRTQLEERVAFEGEWQDTGFMFTRNGGRLHDVDVVSQQFDRLVARLEVPPVTFHELRHTHATLLLAMGVPPHVVSMRLGHTSVAFTLKQYAHVLPQQQAEAVQRLAERLFGEA